MEQRPRYLGACALRIVQAVAWLTACAERDRPDRSPVVQPAQDTIGDQCGYGREAVNRALHDELAPFGLIEVINRGRHRVTGQFQTCLYRVTKRAREVFGGLRFKPGPRSDYDRRVIAKSHGIVEVLPFSSPIAHALGNSPPGRA